MEARKIGIYIKVNDLGNCRLFYRELLDLGEPLLDSDFLTVFELANGCYLTLEKTKAKYLEHSSCAIGWRFEVPDVDKLRARLEDAGYELELEEVQQELGSYYRGRDPEGNLFLIRNLAGDLPAQEEKQRVQQ